MKNFDWKSFLLTAVVFMALDFSYIGMSSKMFQKTILDIQKSSIEPKMDGFLLCYLVLIVGVWYLIIQQKRTVFEAFLLGIFVYSVYELTNYTIFKNWPLHIVIMDSLWGGILFSLTTYIVYTWNK